MGSSQVRDLREAEWTRLSISYFNWLPKRRQHLELLVRDAGAESGTLRIRADMIELPA
ncbi:MAG TPA: hypothetical protein VFW19_02515 [Allosphingosinicella sp.]|nr:hypothetical protein [Allosphingosinicella sp.]